ncbi:MAG: signal peptidase I [Acidobacteria bacterium]|nr:signal peptidase I [Acidobacteriota bacterium]MBI3658139.1 signal peptidase I [Acidobacteriota bacterium]
MSTPQETSNPSPPTLSPIDSPIDPATRLLLEIRGWVPDLFFAALIALFIVFFVVRPVRVEGVSMQPRLVDQERIFVNSFIYHLTEIHRGDIVVFFYPRDTSKSFIKRVIGLPGDFLEIKSGTVFVNGKKLAEPYLDAKCMDFESMPPVKIREGAYFVMGDHRNQSNDSRHWGMVAREYIYGKAMFRYWPMSRFGTLD